jgi:hypothetical protein
VFKQCAFARYCGLEKLPNFNLGLTPQLYASTRFAGCHRSNKLQKSVRQPIPTFASVLRGATAHNRYCGWY